MKKLALTIAVLLSINISNIWAEQNATTASSVRYVKAPRFARPLVEKWITEYAKTQPGVEFQIAKGNQNQGNIDLNVVFDHQDTKTVDFSHTIVYFGERRVRRAAYHSQWQRSRQSAGRQAPELEEAEAALLPE